MYLEVKKYGNCPLFSYWNACEIGFQWGKKKNMLDLALLIWAFEKCIYNMSRFEVIHGFGIWFSEYNYKRAVSKGEVCLLFVFILMTGCPERWWLPHPWRHSGSGWMGIWSPWCTCRCPWSLQGSWTSWPWKVTSNSKDSVIP